MGNSLSRPVTYGLLLLILVSGLALRVWNVNFGRGILGHPDERSTACFYATRIRLPASWAEFWDPHRSPLNPLWNLNEQRRAGFTYGHFPLYLGVASGELLHTAAPLAARLGLPETWTDLMARANQACEAIAIAGRFVIAGLDTLTILLLFLLGRRIYGRGAGLLAAAFYAYAAQAVQLSHFFAMDPASTTFTVLAVLGAVQIVQDRNWRAVVITGVGAGLAIASKFSALPILAAPVVAGLLVAWDAGQRSRRDGVPPDGNAQFMAVAGIPVALLIAGLTFFIASPYAILDWGSFAQATLVEQGAMVRGVADWPFTRQYRNTIPYLYFIEQQVRWGLGWPLGLVAVAGTLYALGVLFNSLYRVLVGGQWLSREALALLVVWSWVIPYFGITGAFLAKFNRYMSPVLPFVLLFAAGLIWRLWGMQNVERRTQNQDGEETDGIRGEDQTRSSALLGRSAQGLAVLLAVVGLVGGLFWSVAYVNGVYNHEYTWITATRWLYQNAPHGSVVLYEQWDDGPPHSVPGEPGLDQRSVGVDTINWGPYEEDTAEKYEILKERLRQADFVWYSSKRIYGSVVELPERYPMTTRYYEAMWSGELGFELALDVTSPPRLFGFVFEDRTADESWSLYDHPQVTVFRKVRELTDAEFDAVLGGTWQTAIPYYRGQDSPLSPLLNLLGLGSQPGSEGRGLVGRMVGLVSGADLPAGGGPVDRPALLLERPLADLPVVDNYRWNRVASESPLLATLWWWVVLALLGWAAWPLAFYLCRPLRDRGYLLSRTLGWLLAGWLLWWLASAGWAVNSVLNSWLALAVVGLVGLAAAVWQWPEIRSFLRTQWPLLLTGEALFAVAYLFFIWIRLHNPDLWQPWFGGEKFMEFAFLNGILRSPSFPPVDPHFAGGYINYYYFGLYLVAYLVKLTGIYAEVAFNLAIPTLFALTAVNAFAVAYSAFEGVGSREWGVGKTGSRIQDTEYRMPDTESSTPVDGDAAPPHLHSPTPPPPHTPLPWRAGLGVALLASLFVTVIGNLDGFAELVRKLAQVGESRVQSTFGLVQTAGAALSGLGAVLSGQRELPRYDFWAPSRVIPDTINEFPYWSFLYADLHPHVIGIPLALLFLGLLYTLIAEYRTDWSRAWGRGVALLALFGLLLGTLAGVNLWELPTYFGLGVLALLMIQVRRQGRIHWLWTGGLALLYLALAYLFYLPFFQHYVGVGASGVGLVREGDDLGRWLLIWGLFLFVLLSWLLYAASRPLHRELVPAQERSATASRPFFDPAPLGIVYPPGGIAAEPDKVEIPAEEAVIELIETGAEPRVSVAPLGGERWASQALRFFDRLPRLIYLQRLLVQQPSLGYLLTPTMIVGSLVAALVSWWLGWSVLALCLALLGLAVVMLWRRSREATPATLFVTLLLATGLAILAGTQVIYLKDWLSGGGAYRMNTVFKFFSQVWVLWGVAAAIGVGQLWQGWLAPTQDSRRRNWLRPVWPLILVLLVVASLAYPLYGTPSRLDMRMVGWRPPFGTLNGLDYMREGSYTWGGRNQFNQDLPETLIELRYDWPAIQWLLDHVGGNLVIVESSEKDYYRAGGTRITSMTGLSGLLGMHAGEQRYGEAIGPRDALYREFWNTPDLMRTQQIIDELDVALVYAGQLERHHHPEGVEKLAQMAQLGMLTVLYENERTTLYAVPGRLTQTPVGTYVPVAPVH